ncbi:prepilin-type N-terminal cleavage/methylation domain-containing protein [Vibrio apostichopi]|uniref:prepilin-type N-terminal cleavage/methylation domain-containing protein n=1 Tax=Vibrio apostichopi TaxID=3035453 RepID=UPI002573B344|nr:prepilin-type N-terminal cleavage/methylation domain-containing protein [Vibrio sp. FE10]
MKATKKGFTLIELVVVIVILGVLAVVAAPKFLNIQHDARASVIEGVAAALSNASEIGHGKGILAGFEHDQWADKATEDESGRQYHYGFPAVKPKGMPLFIDLDAAYNMSDGTEFVWATYDNYSPGYTVPVYMIYTLSELVEAKTHFPYPTTAEIEATQCYARYEIHAFADSSGAETKVVTETSGC